ncbi:fibroblast growth factor 2-like [Saccoglossus kowalevskii]
MSTVMLFVFSLAATLVSVELRPLEKNNLKSLSDPKGVKSNNNFTDIWDCPLTNDTCYIQADTSSQFSGTDPFTFKSAHGWYLRISPNGTVSGTREKDEYTHIEKSAAGSQQWLVTLKGVKSNRYLLIDKKGRIKSTKLKGPDARCSECNFFEKLDGRENYTIFESADRRMANGKKPWHIALSRRDGCNQWSETSPNRQKE